LGGKIEGRWHTTHLFRDWRAKGNALTWGRQGGEKNYVHKAHQKTPEKMKGIPKGETGWGRDDKTGKSSNFALKETPLTRERGKKGTQGEQLCRTQKRERNIESILLMSIGVSGSRGKRKGLSTQGKKKWGLKKPSINTLKIRVRQAWPREGRL